MLFVIIVNFLLVKLILASIVFLQSFSERQFVQELLLILPLVLCSLYSHKTTELESSLTGRLFLFMFRSIC